MASLIKSKSRSIIRSCIPFHIHGQGSMTHFVQAGFLQRPPLIQEVLTTLEQLEDIPSAPRIAVAAAFQCLFDGGAQRDVRNAFDQAELICRRTSLQYGEGGTLGFDPLAALLVHELRMTSMYYNRLFLPTTIGAAKQASLALKHLHDHDICNDELLDFEDLLSEEGRDACPQRKWDALQELLKLERDLYGEYRLDLRGAKHKVFADIEASDLEKTRERYGIMKCPLVEQFGNFSIREEDKSQGRWLGVRISCLKEEHKLPLVLDRNGNIDVIESAVVGASMAAAAAATETEPKFYSSSPVAPPPPIPVAEGRRHILLPNVDEVIADNETKDRARVIFHRPIIFRDQENASKEHRNGRKFEEQHVISFELPAERPKDFEASLSFIDRYFRTRPNSALW